MAERARSVKIDGNNRAYAFDTMHPMGKTALSDTLPRLRILMVAPTSFFADYGCHVRIFEEARALMRHQLRRAHEGHWVFFGAQVADHGEREILRAGGVRHVRQRGRRLPDHARLCAVFRRQHRHAGFLAVEGIVAARDPHFFPEQGDAPHRPSQLLLWEADEPDHTEDISPTIERKMAALLEHRSQYRTTMDVDDHDSIDQLQAFREKIRNRAADAGAGEGFAYGEQFKLIAKL